ncbi:hypothetical protein G6F35_018251 [Rhizopus arrhizus]|nr:hypothetical protein G6F35_018251 [Rhizopus arrhizus]
MLPIHAAQRADGRQGSRAVTVAGQPVLLQGGGGRPGDGDAGQGGHPGREAGAQGVFVAAAVDGFQPRSCQQRVQAALHRLPAAQAGAVAAGGPG